MLMKISIFFKKIKFEISKCQEVTFVGTVTGQIQKCLIKKES